MEDRESGSDLVGKREQVELGAEAAVVAALGFLEPVQVLGERGLRFPGAPVDPLEHRAVLVAPPVRARDLRELERAQLARRRHVRARHRSTNATSPSASRCGTGRPRRVADLARVVASASPSRTFSMISRL